MKHNKSGLNSRFKLSILVYIFSGIVLVVGVLVIFFSFSASHAILGNEIFFQLAGFGELAQVILRPLQATIINIGLLVFTLFLILAGMLFVIGRMLDRQARLLERIQAIENKIDHNDTLK